MVIGIAGRHVGKHIEVCLHDEVHYSFPRNEMHEVLLVLTFGEAVDTITVRILEVIKMLSCITNNPC